MAYFGPLKNRTVQLTSPGVTIVCTVDNIDKHDRYYEVWMTPLVILPSNNVIPFSLCGKMYQTQLYLWGAPYDWSYAIGC